MKVGLGQINTTPNDFEGNTHQILIYTAAAAKQDCDLVVFPELSICGYLCRDLLYREWFIESNLRHLGQIVEASAKFPELTIVVGYVDRNTKGSGKPFANMAAAIRNGLLIATYQKRLLPFYDVFDEGRYYEPGDQPCIITVPGGARPGYRCAITICEDIWNDKDQDDYYYRENPVGDVNYDFIINLSSSPYAFGKPNQRLRMLKAISENKQCGLIYVNQVGGQDELVFDGNSCIFNRGSLTTLAQEPGLSVAYTDSVNKIRINKPLEELHRSLLIGLRDYIHKAGFEKVVLGSSGGIDSALVAALACEAVGPQNVFCIKMPSKYSSQGSLVDAEKLHANLGCQEITIPIDHQATVDHLSKSLFSIFDPKTINPVADENIQARMRGNIIMYASNAFGMLALSTGNKTELALGYCTLYGDMNGGFNPIGDLYKDQVYGMASYLNQNAGKEIVPENIIKKAPSAELTPDQTDENSLLPYPILNLIVRCFIEHHISTFDEFSRFHTLDADSYPFAQHKYFNGFYQNKLVMDNVGELTRKDYNRMIRLIDLMEFKRRQAAPCIKVSKVAFGTGRRLPVIQSL